MTNDSAKHERDVWEKFWEQKSELAKVYSPSARIIENLKIAGNLDKKIILEVGAGTGRTSFELVQFGATIIILDYAESSLKIMQELFRSINTKIYIIQADAFHLPFKEGVIDIVFHQGLIEHFKYPGPILSENFRVLKCNGLALVDVPQKYHIYTVIKHILMFFNRWFAGWETEYSIAELKKMIRITGFNIIHIYGEWMHPSLFYRILREVLKKINIELPLYPHGPKFLSKIRSAIRETIKRFPFSKYTFLDIGVICRKG